MRALRPAFPWRTRRTWLPRCGSAKEGWLRPRASRKARRPGGRGTRKSLGRERGEAGAESRRGRAFPQLIAEGGLSHGAHVSARPGEGKGSRGNRLCSGEKVHPQEGPRLEDRTSPLAPEGRAARGDL